VSISWLCEVVSSDVTNPLMRKFAWIALLIVSLVAASAADKNAHGERVRLGQVSSAGCVCYGPPLIVQGNASGRAVVRVHAVRRASKCAV
jgi:hypothetical protein